MLTSANPATSHGTITLICVGLTKVGVPGVLLNSTWTPWSVEFTVPCAFTVNWNPPATQPVVGATQAGPRLAPRIAINSPGATAPKPKVALLMMVTTEGTAAAVTFTVTLTVMGVESADELIVICPVSDEPPVVPAGKLAGLTETLIPFDNAVPVELLLVSMASHPPVLVADAVKATAPPVLETVSCWGAGVDPPT